MSSNVGLTTPRGSGTSGYVQRNMSFLRPRDNVPMRDPSDAKTYHQRAPDQSILEHDRKREVEVRCLELQDKLEDEGVDDDEIETQVEALRRKLVAELEAGGGGLRNARGLKSHQVHELAAAKLVETERLRNALGISKDYEEGSHWRRQEEERGRRQEMREQAHNMPPPPAAGRSSRRRSRSASPL